MHAHAHLASPPPPAPAPSPCPPPTGPSPQLRTIANIRLFNAELKQADFDLARWRELRGSKYDFALLVSVVVWWFMCVCGGRGHTVLCCVGRGMCEWWRVRR